MEPETNEARARRIYPDEGEDHFYGPGDYNPMIEDFGAVLVTISDSDYQGDTHALVSVDGRVGFITFGWGSCSGCDALQACNSYHELGELIVDFEKSIKWFDSLAAAKAYIAKDEDRELSHYWHNESWPDFKDAVAAL